MIKLGKQLKQAVLMTCYGASPRKVMIKTGVSPRRVKKALVVIRMKQKQELMMRQHRQKQEVKLSLVSGGGGSSEAFNVVQ